MQKSLNTTTLESIARVADIYEASLKEFLSRRIPHEYADTPEAFAAFFQGVIIYLTSD